MADQHPAFSAYVNDPHAGSKDGSDPDLNMVGDGKPLAGNGAVVALGRTDLCRALVTDGADPHSSGLRHAGRERDLQFLL